MVKYIYNGVKLPFLPEVDGYDYKVLVEFNDAGTYVLYCMTSPLMRTGEVLYPNKLTAPYMSCTASVDGYGEFSQGTSDLKLAALYVPIWSNHDIYTTDGTLYLAATEPVPVGKPITDPLSFTMGYNWMKAMLAKREKRKPVAYLYNGVQLPKIPEVEGYDYCYLRMFMGSVPQLYISTEPAYYEDGVHFSGNVQMAICSDGVWNDFSVTEITSVADCVWCNTDILNADGTTYLAASEPVPVYE